MTFGQAYTASWRGSVAFIAACPLLALVPVLPELLQHAVEVQRGMYDSLAAAKAADADPVRLGFGLVKVLGLALPGYWIARFLAWRVPALAARFDPPAVRSFAVVLLVEMTLAAVQLFAVPRSGGWLVVQLVAGQLVGCLLTAWTAAAPLGQREIGPAASLRIMARMLPSSLALLILAALPLMIPHYVLGAAALVGPRVLRWPILIVDALLVGWLSALMTASTFVVAQRACAAAGIALVPPPPPAASGRAIIAPR